MKKLLITLLIVITTYGCSNEKDSILIPINAESTESTFKIEESASYTLALVFSCDCEGNPTKAEDFSRDITGLNGLGEGSIQTNVTITIKSSGKDFIEKTYIKSGSSGSIYTKLGEQDLRVKLRVLDALPQLKNGNYSIKIEKFSPNKILEKYRTFILISYLDPKV
ncbi:DUF5625 family protein [Pseudomonas sp. PDM13]|uniref:DUF5625 family protein n=1 Tax=Pseudomonas sp. PDM13 TaxID=2769255 RepID=UPI0021DFBC81|nr:DUF5625 family protein [Pseudomonas sp. PDM13]MCU9951753.1 hypothetical protein [Pseudomonas sp. PDM13]